MLKQSQNKSPLEKWLKKINKDDLNIGNHLWRN